MWINYRLSTNIKKLCLERKVKVIIKLLHCSIAINPDNNLTIKQFNNAAISAINNKSNKMKIRWKSLSI
jgi:hypothetical protein